MSNNNNQGEPAMVLLMVVALLGGLGWVVWHVSRGFWLDYVFRWLRYGEMWIVNLFAHHYDACLLWLRYAQVNNTTPSAAMIAVTNTCFGAPYLNSLSATTLPSYYMMSMPPIVTLGAMVAYYYKWPLAAVLAAIAVRVLFFSPHSKFQTKHTLETFIATQAKMWPVITPIVKFNPSKSGRILGDAVPDKLPMFAEPLSPEEWIAWNAIPVVNGAPDREAARRAFILQLGPRWNGIDVCPPHIRGLFAAFASKGAQHRDQSDELLGRLALAWSPDAGFRMDGQLTADVDAIIRDSEAGGKALEAANHHAWRTTAMLGVLRWARANGGVLAPAQFLWLRAEDRALWYPLNNLGRRSYHSEGAGAMAHFMAEQSAQKPLPVPRVDTAAETLKTYLDTRDNRSIPIPPREPSKA